MIALGLAVAGIRAGVVGPASVQSGSMEPTLLAGDIVLVNQVGRRDAAAGEIVVFRPPHEPFREVVKRIVAVGGDEVEMRRGALWVNGKGVDSIRGDRAQWIHREAPEFSWQSSYIVRTVPQGDYAPRLGSWGPLVVPEGAVFVLGDNRGGSIDSRYWGFLDRELIQGRVRWIIASVKSSGGVAGRPRSVLRRERTLRRIPAWAGIGRN